MRRREILVMSKEVGEGRVVETYASMVRRSGQRAFKFYNLLMHGLSDMWYQVLHVNYNTEEGQEAGTPTYIWPSVGLLSETS